MWEGGRKGKRRQRERERQNNYDNLVAVQKVSHLFHIVITSFIHS